jgi:hypothetical protein
LQASGARKEIVDDLVVACHGLEPFAAHPMKEFAAFLVRAEEYARTGIVPVIAKPSPAARVTKAKVPALTFQEANSLVASIYERAISDEVTQDHITNEVRKLDKLSAKDLTEVARQFGVVPGKTKKASLDAIQEKISRRKTTHVRTLF